MGVGWLGKGGKGGRVEEEEGGLGLGMRSWDGGGGMEGVVGGKGETRGGGGWVYKWRGWGWKKGGSSRCLLWRWGVGRLGVSSVCK